MFRIASALLVILLSPLFSQAQLQYITIGTYTNESPSKGIYVYSFNPKTLELKELSVAEARNPSYLAISKTGNFLYSVNETDEGQISAFAVHTKTKQLTLLNTEDNNGSAPCYVSLDKTGKWLFSANYFGGNLTVHPIVKNGHIGPVQQLIQHNGTGPNTARQEKAHMHCTYIAPDNKFLYAVDLGIDKVMAYPFNAAKGFLDTAKAIAITIEPGGGPRHIEFAANGRYAYVVEELSGAVDVFAVKSNGDLSLLQKSKDLPAGEVAAGADIHLSPDGNFLYVSQRSNSTIQLYKVNKAAGTIKYMDAFSTMGQTPRNFGIDPTGRFLFAANQNTNNIVVFKRDILNGRLVDTGKRITVGKPVCVKWLP